MKSAFEKAGNAKKTVSRFANLFSKPGAPLLEADIAAARFKAMRAAAQADLAAQMGEAPDFFSKDPEALDKLVDFMANKGVITTDGRAKTRSRSKTASPMT